MTHHSVFRLLITALVVNSALSAQTVLNNYYNAPSYLTPPGLPGGYFPNFQSQPQYFGTNPGAIYSTPGTSYATTTTAAPVYVTGTPTPLSTTTIPSGNVVQQIYPQPAQPIVTQATAIPPAPQSSATQAAPLQIQQLPLQYVAPPDALLPGLFTIKNSKWVLADYFYNLPQNIGVKVEVVKPQGKYIPLSDQQLESRIKGILQDANITTDALNIPCQPPNPMFYVLIMAYPCDRRMVGFISIQLLENARPQRMDEVDINGFWLAVTWEKTALVASATEDFAQEVGETIDQFTRSFADAYKFYHPYDEQPCFDVGEDDP